MRKVWERMPVITVIDNKVKICRTFHNNKIVEVWHFGLARASPTLVAYK
jgi:hypothetical protein